MYHIFIFFPSGEGHLVCLHVLGIMEKQMLWLGTFWCLGETWCQGNPQEPTRMFPIKNCTNGGEGVWLVTSLVTIRDSLSSDRWKQRKIQRQYYTDELQETWLRKESDIKEKSRDCVNQLGLYGGAYKDSWPELVGTHGRWTSSQEAWVGPI